MTSSLQPPSPSPDASPSLPPPLPSELWIPILGFLRRPIPAALSCAPRSDLLQPDLCSAARVCKLFGEICQSILFRHIATDRLHLILPSTPAQIPSKRRLLAYIVSLSLEYRDKCEQPSYNYLMRKKGGWELIGPDHPTMDRIAMDGCKVEVEDMVWAFTVVAEAGPSREILPNLVSLSLGSIYGGQGGADATWGRYIHSIDNARRSGVRRGSLDPHPDGAAQLLHNFWLSSDITRICQRSINGPFSRPTSPSPTDYPRVDTIKIIHTVHFHPDIHLNILPMPIHYNQSLQWISDAPSSTPRETIVNMIRANLSHAMKLREDGTIKGGPDDTIILWVWASVTIEEPLAPEMANYFEHADDLPVDPTMLYMLNTRDRRRIFHTGNALAMEHFKRSGIRTSILWFPTTSESAGRCFMCGSLPPPY